VNISTAISKLQEILAQQGDLPLMVMDDGSEEADIAIIVKEATLEQYRKPRPHRVILLSASYLDEDECVPPGSGSSAFGTSDDPLFESSAFGH